MTTLPPVGIEVIGIDGDDTLWHSEGHFHVTEQRFVEILEPWVNAGTVSSALLDAERRNLALFGYGVKGFTLSMIETALTLSGHRIDATQVERILALGKELLAHPVELLDGVAETLDVLRRDHRLVLITKGDLFHQESKVAASGVAELFEGIEIVAEKDPATYARVLARMGAEPGAFCMVGNSVRSDIAPVLELGGAGVHVPYHVTWALEHAEVSDSHPRLARVGGHRRGARGDRRAGRAQRRGMSIDWPLLRKEAVAMTSRSYAPYSGVLVGAAGIAADGRLVRGCNVENASYGVTLCAECGLVSDLVASGGGPLVALAVVAGDGRPLAPCGRCRQVLYEHGGADLLLDAGDGEPKRLGDLLPDAFGPEDVRERSGR